MAGDPILEIANVSKSFAALKALDRVNAKILRGQVVGIVGLNGSGKSVLLDIISGITRPDSGCVQFRNRPNACLEALAGRDAVAVSRLGVARTFQRPVAPRMLTVKECVEFALLRSEGDDVMGVLSRFGLETQQGARVGELSGGMRKQVDLACALAAKPVLALLDEPFCALAPDLRIRLRKQIGDLKTRGGTVVIVEHDLWELLHLADWVFQMDRGSVVKEGLPSHVLSEESIASGLGHSGKLR